MAGLKGITCNTSVEQEPHIYAEDDAAIFKAIFGKDRVSSIGQQCKATILSNNKVRIADGVLCVDGHFARIPYGEYVDCEIENGQSGKNRNDIIIAKFETTGTGGIDKMTCEVKKGTAGTSATDPSLTQEDIYQGGKIREFPLYRVKIEGLNIVGVDQLFTVAKTNEELENEVTELNSNSFKGIDVNNCVVFADYNYQEFRAKYEQDCFVTVGVSACVQGHRIMIDGTNIANANVDDDGAYVGNYILPLKKGQEIYASGYIRVKVYAVK